MSETELLTQVLAKLEVIDSELRQQRRLLEHGVMPPEWVTAEALATSLGIKLRSVEFYRYNLGVIPVDGQACRKAGRHYEYRIDECKKLIDKHKSLSPETRRSLRELWKQQQKEVA